MGDLQPTGELAASGLHDERRFRVEPEDGPVLVAITVGVFDGRLGLADAAQAADGLGQDGLAAPGEPLPDFSDDLVPTGEELVWRMRDAPERQAQRRRPGWWRWAL
jgi:hypothetical protein